MMQTVLKPIEIYQKHNEHTILGICKVDSMHPNNYLVPAEFPSSETGNLCFYEESFACIEHFDLTWPFPKQCQTHILNF